MIGGLIKISNINIYLQWVKDNRVYLFISIGLILFTCHSDWFIYNIGNKTALFLPQIGVMLIGLSTALLIILGEIDLRQWPKKQILIPLSIIILFTIISCLIDFNSKTISNIVMILSAYLLYHVGKYYGMKIFIPFAIFSIIESLSVIIMAITEVNPHIRNGGLISLYNYSLAKSFIIIGIITGLYFIKNTKYKSLFLTINLLGLIFTGSPEVLVIIPFVGLWFIYKKDFSKELVYGLFIVIIITTLWFTVGHGQKEYNRVSEVTTFALNGDMLKTESWDNNVTEDEYSWGLGRLPLYKHSIQNISFFGNGYHIYSKNISNETAEKIEYSMVHNVPLVIVDQIGLIPALAWCYLIGYCLIKYKYKVLWLAVIGLGLFNHTTWTIYAVYVWVLIGITTNYEGLEYVFRQKNIKADS